jgi:hypothetical protein
MAAQVRKATQIAGLYFLRCETFAIGPKPSPLETADFPENVLFRRLDSMQPREKPVSELRPGRLLVAVYGDNWCGALLAAAVGKACMSCDMHSSLCLQPQPSGA